METLSNDPAESKMGERALAFVNKAFAELEFDSDRPSIEPISHTIDIDNKTDDRSTHQKGSGGIEPPLRNAVTPDPVCTCDKCNDPRAANALHSCGPNCHFVTSFDVDLQSVIQAWEHLPKSIRNAIAGLVHSQEGSER